MSELKADAPRPRRRRLVALLALGAATLGLAAGVASPLLFATTTEAAASASPSEAAPVTAHLEIGRIAVNLRPVDDDRDGARHLIVDAILAYDATKLAGAEGDLEEQQPYLRDAFIDYLSNLTKDEVSGSSGMARMRGELLRRASAVIGNDAPQALLIQDYILQ